jgi:hypothetical protein
VSDQNTGRRFTINVAVAAKHEVEARTLALRECGDQDLLMDTNLLSLDINENLDRAVVVSIAATV